MIGPPKIRSYVTGRQGRMFDRIGSDRSMKIRRVDRPPGFFNTGRRRAGSAEPDPLPAPSSSPTEQHSRHRARLEMRHGRHERPSERDTTAVQANSWDGRGGSLTSDVATAAVSPRRFRRVLVFSTGVSSSFHGDPAADIPCSFPLWAFCRETSWEGGAGEICPGQVRAGASRNWRMERTTGWHTQPLEDLR